jgi:large subunit ribosomal protein L15
MRGYKNKPTSQKSQVVNIGDLEKRIDGKIINPEILDKAGLVDLKKGRRIKILGDGELKKSYHFEGVEFSKKAKQKIETASGIKKQEV